MSEAPQNSENLIFRAEEINDINRELFKKLWKMTRNYSQVRYLLRKGVVNSSEDMEAEISTVDWVYVFRRNLQEYLSLSVTKRPAKGNEDFAVSEERVDLVYSKNFTLGEKPLIQHDINFAGRLLQPPRQRNNPIAVTEVIDFFSELEKQI